MLKRAPWLLLIASFSAQAGSLNHLICADGVSFEDAYPVLADGGSVPDFAAELESHGADRIVLKLDPGTRALRSASGKLAVRNRAGQWVERDLIVRMELKDHTIGMSYSLSLSNAEGAPLGTVDDGLAMGSLLLGSDAQDGIIASMTVRFERELSIKPQLFRCVFRK